VRILHFNYIPRLSGAESLAVALATEHASQGHAVALASLAPAESSFAPLRTGLQEMAVPCLFPSAALQRFRRARWVQTVCRDFKPDVVLAHSVIPSAYVRTALLGRPSLAVVSVLHSSSEDDYEHPFFGATECLLKRRAAAIVTVTERAARNYAARFGTRSRIVTIPNGIDLDRFRFDVVARERCRAELGARPTDRVILQAGRFGPVKDQAATIRAFQQLVRRGECVHLWLAGIEEDMAYVTDVRNLCTALKLADRIRFLGPRRDMPALLAAADLFVMPSRQEAHSVAMLEALVSGIPIVASNIQPFVFAAAQPEVTLTETTDDVVFAGALMDACRAPRAVRPVDGYSIKRTAAKYMSLLEQVS
jgi:glycosyltransferase involved in cell wall biosynthesis